jgi:DNA-binding PadR family transcriptional regulator
MADSQAMRFSVNKILILKVLLDNQKPMAISEINSTINKLSGKKVPISTTSNEIKRMIRSGYINYYNVSVDFSSNNKHVIITESGVDYFNKLKEDFRSYLRYINDVDKFVNEK